MPIDFRFMIRRFEIPLMLLSIILAGCFAYSNALRGPFLMDDLWILEQDRTSYFHYQTQTAAKTDALSPDWTETAVNLNYRPLSQWLPLAMHAAFGNDVLFHHTFNLILFLAACLMIFLFILRLFDDKALAWLTALLFCAHPLNSLMVDYISAVVFSLQLILMLASILFFIDHTQHRKILPLIFSMIFLYLSAQCHEMSICLPAFLFVWLVTVKKYTVRQSLLRLWPMLALSAGLAALWLIHAPKTTDMIRLQDHLSINAVQHTAGLFQLLAWYFTKFLFLHGVTLMFVLPADRISILYGLGIGLSLLLILGLTFRKWSRDPVIFWALGWFAAGLLIFVPASRFQPSHGLTIEPHWFYLGSIGCFAVMARGLLMFQTYKRWLPLLLTIFILTGYIQATRRVNTYWSDNTLYGRYLLANNPDYITARIFLANAYLQKNSLDRAEELYLQSLNGTDMDGIVYNNLGVIADKSGRTKEAVDYYEKTLAIIPDLAGTLNNLGIIHRQAGEYFQAENNFLKAIDANPWILSTRVNLAKLYIQQERFTEAADILRKNLDIAPDDSPTLETLRQAENAAQRTTSAD